MVHTVVLYCKKHDLDLKTYQNKLFAPINILFMLKMLFTLCFQLDLKSLLIMFNS